MLNALNEKVDCVERLGKSSPGVEMLLLLGDRQEKLREGSRASWKSLACNEEIG